MNVNKWPLPFLFNIIFKTIIYAVNVTQWIETSSKYQMITILKCIYYFNPWQHRSLKIVQYYKLGNNNGIHIENMHYITYSFHIYYILI